MTNGLVGSRFGMSLAWVVVVGIVGICVFAEMSGRVAAVSGRATFDLVRERLGPASGWLNLVASMAVTLLTFTAEIGGVALALELATDVNTYLWIPVVGAAVWLVLWRVQVLGPGECVRAGASPSSSSRSRCGSWGRTGQTCGARPPGRRSADESHTTYFYYAVALFGAAMTPYEVFFFSSGGVEERWTSRDLATMRANVFVGFPLGGSSRWPSPATAAVVYLPQGVQVDTLGQIGLPVALALGQARHRLRAARLLRRDVRGRL